MADLTVDTQRLREAAGQLDDGAVAFRRVAAGPSGASITPGALGAGGSAHEVVERIGQRLQHGAECTDLLSQRSRRLADSVREAAASFDRAEAELARAPR